MSFLKPKNWLNVALHLLLIVALSMGGILFFFFIYLPNETRHGEIIEVPNLENMAISKAIETLAKNNLRFEITDTVYSAKHGPGSVVSQLPKAYSEVKHNRRVYLNINTFTKPSIEIKDSLQLSKFRKRDPASIKRHILELGLVFDGYDSVRADYIGFGYETMVNGDTLRIGDKLHIGTPVKILLGAGADYDDGSLDIFDSPSFPEDTLLLEAEDIDINDEEIESQDEEFFNIEDDEEL